MKSKGGMKNGGPKMGELCLLHSTYSKLSFLTTSFACVEMSKKSLKLPKSAKKSKPKDGKSAKKGKSGTIFITRVLLALLRACDVTAAHLLIISISLGKGDCRDYCRVSASLDLEVPLGGSCKTDASVTEDTPVCCDGTLVRSEETDYDVEYLGFFRGGNGGYDSRPSCLPCRDCYAPQEVSVDCCIANGLACPGICCKCRDDGDFKRAIGDEYICAPEGTDCEYECENGSNGAVPGAPVCALQGTCSYQGRAEGVCCKQNYDTTCTWCDECGKYLDCLLF